MSKFKTFIVFVDDEGKKSTLVKHSQSLGEAQLFAGEFELPIRHACISRKKDNGEGYQPDCRAAITDGTLDFWFDLASLNTCPICGGLH